MSKVERQMNLVICLLSTRQFLTAERIRQTVLGYPRDASDEAFSRMFERDKNELRDLGIPLETGRVSSFTAEEGYRIKRDAYELPDIDLTAGEAAAVAVAARLWQSPELASAAQSALLKLRAAGIAVEQDPTLTEVSTAAPRTRGSEPALSALLAAIDAGRPVRFSHRSARTEPYRVRTVEPWAVVTYRGRWYLVGHDRDRHDTRTFRLSRIDDDVTAFGDVGEVRRPSDADPRAIVARVAGQGPVMGSATVWVASDRVHELRRIATQADDRTIEGRSGTVLRIPVRSWDWLARSVAGHGADAVVLSPPELRDDVLTRLTRAAVPDNREVRQ